MGGSFSAYSIGQFGSLNCYVCGLGQREPREGIVHTRYQLFELSVTSSTVTIESAGLLLKLVVNLFTSSVDAR